MGLSASQARLLTITARKSDCEFQSMRYSHDKLALSRNMTDISSEYQNALNQTKLVYDYYGKGDTTTPLSYNLLMTPSQLNGYMPTLVTDASGKAVLNSQYAAAASAAGIPQEGLGSLPSSDVRNRFLQGLADNGLITQELAKTCMSIDYSQEIGLGTKDYKDIQTKTLSVKDLLEKIDNTGFLLDLSDSRNNWLIKNKSGTNLDDWFNAGNKISMTELLTNNYSIYQVSEDEDGMFARFGNGSKGCNVQAISHMSCWEDILGAFNNALNDGTDLSKKALEYATSKTRNLVYFSDNSYTSYDDQTVSGTLMSSPSKENPCSGWGGYGDKHKGWSKRRADVKDHMQKSVENYIGYYGFDGRNGGSLNTYDGVGISISNIAKSFLTYYMQFIEGYNSDYMLNTDLGLTVGGGRGLSGQRYSETSGARRTVADSNLVDLNADCTFTLVESVDLNSDQALYSGFYDALFNQICTRGWVENNEIMDNNYMQEMLQNGMMYLANVGDDGYYYQGNYATNTFIKEISDEEAITKAEAKYNTEKQKINSKEQIIDLKMKNLDTEMSSLTTEYDTVKSLISKNIEKGFKRYDA